MFGAIKSATLAMMIVAVAASCSTGANVADADMAGKAIDARRALMKSNGKNMKVIGGFVKKGTGSAADAAKSARMIASNMAQFPNHYPKGTAQGSGAGNTRAKPEIWTAWTKFAGGAAWT